MVHKFENDFMVLTLDLTNKRLDITYRSIKDGKTVLKEQYYLKDTILEGKKHEQDQIKEMVKKTNGGYY